MLFTASSSAHGIPADSGTIHPQHAWLSRPRDGTMGREPGADLTQVMPATAQLRWLVRPDQPPPKLACAAAGAAPGRDRWLRGVSTSRASGVGPLGARPSIRGWRTRSSGRDPAAGMGSDDLRGHGGRGPPVDSSACGPMADRRTSGRRWGRHRVRRRAHRRSERSCRVARSRGCPSRREDHLVSHR